MLAIKKHFFSDNKSARNRQARGIYFIHLKKKKKRSILITETINNKISFVYCLTIIRLFRLVRISYSKFVYVYINLYLIRDTNNNF